MHICDTHTALSGTLSVSKLYLNAEMLNAELILVILCKPEIHISSGVYNMF